MSPGSSTPRAVSYGATARRARPRKHGLDVRRATDILWTINHPDTWHLLVTLRGRPPKRYEEWAAEAARAQLLR